MANYPNYRIAVGIVIWHEGKILLTKRSGNSLVYPNVWCVPSGKVKYEEKPIEALYREAKEETNLDVVFLEELDQRTFKGESAAGDIFRLVFTYLVVPKPGSLSHLSINEEHSEYTWVSKEDLSNSRYFSIHSTLKRLLFELFDKRITA
ncbi:NUDIX domain-containing protein [Paenibacillus humicus]|uniref:NUDIX domain-containing protein n=1 Tax=Paenibacillus humicus TaxID=412861 RepID=UPI000FDB8C8D|nr:NUDIX hydrolase [Paenibacillus humicus]